MTDDEHLPDDPGATKFLLQLFGDLGLLGVVLTRGNDFGTLDRAFPRWVGSTPGGDIVYVCFIPDEASPAQIMGAWVPRTETAHNNPQNDRRFQFLLWRESEEAEGEVFEAARGAMIALINDSEDP